ncbi:MAG: hypothetical protein ACLRM9_05885 [Collinsella aerofaciens]
MLISEAIQAIQDYCGGIDAFTGKPIELATTRDRVFTATSISNVPNRYMHLGYGGVISRAKELGANLIVPHECCSGTTRQP